MFSFAGPLLVSEVLATIRNQCDKLIVGAMLGIEALGIYYFAYNAGLGLSLSLTNALNASLYPHLAEVADRPTEMIAPSTCICCHSCGSRTSTKCTSLRCAFSNASVHSISGTGRDRRKLNMGLDVL